MSLTISEVKAANKARAEKLGRAYWFGKDETRFFSTRIESKVFEGKGGAYFVTSEQCIMPSFTGPRLYTVRRALKSGEISTIGKFQGFKFVEDARDAARKFASGKERAPAHA